MPIGGRSEAADGCREYRRTGIARVLFAVVRRRDAGAASVAGDEVRLAGRLGGRTLRVVEVGTVDEQFCWGWGAVRIGSAGGTRTVSGLSRGDASGLAEAVRVARLGAWREKLREQAKRIESIEARLATLKQPRSYVRQSAFGALLAAVRTEAAELPVGWPQWAPRGPEYRSVERIRAFLEDPEWFRAEANGAYLADELKRTREFLDGVEKQPLTDEQRRAVLVDDDRNLVVAAAGSGKTSVMVAKAGWAAARGDRRWSDMLLLAFARNAREELADRVASYLGAEAAADMKVSTFHALGLSIIGTAEGRRPTLAKVAEDGKALLPLLEEIIEGLLRDRTHGRAFIRWLAYRSVPYRSEHEFESYPAYWDYVLTHETRTLRGELVKSLEECFIANFLHLNGVAYEYERPYEHDTATAEKAQYKPDFYLTEAGVYIEHLALSVAGKTPPFIDQEEYTASLRWKRELHERHGTTLVETYSHEQSDGGLTERLREKLEAEGVAFKPIARSEIFALLNEQKRVEPFTQLIATFLEQLKGSRLSMAAVRARAAAQRDGGRAQAFMDVFEPIFESYQARLAESREIDFHDMINRATDHVAAGRYRSPYGYILVDEFQDISPGRAALVKALLDQREDAQLFAVGDDWQAIYRFAGADIGEMLSFHERFGAGARTELATTFRCSDGVSAVATQFVLANPEQITKEVRTTRRVEGPGVWLGLGGDEARVDEALERIVADAEAAGVVRPTVLLLGRYRGRDRDLRRQVADAQSRLEISSRTVHSAKGLEADYVVVHGLCAGRYGFPTEMTDDPLLDLVLPRREAHANAEERRLLYVALTRARRRAYLLEEGVHRSAFVAELLDVGEGVGVFGEPSAAAASAACPACGKGRLVAREATGGDRFYGCSYYPLCEHTEPPCPSCGEGRPVRANGSMRCDACGATVEACGRCDGWLREITGKHGPFLGCTNYPVCKFTRNLARRGPKAGSRTRDGRGGSRRRRVS